MSRFSVVRTNLINNETTPLQVGNGDFAFNVDNTGMQVHPTEQISQLIYSTLADYHADVSPFQYTLDLGLA